MKRSILSLLLAIAMACTLIPPAWAAEGGGVTVRVASATQGGEFPLGPFEAAYTQDMSAWDAVKAALEEVGFDGVLCVELDRPEVCNFHSAEVSRIYLRDVLGI